jgi:hypothetical protein
MKIFRFGVAEADSFLCVGSNVVTLHYGWAVLWFRSLEFYRRHDVTMSGISHHVNPAIGSWKRAAVKIEKASERDQLHRHRERCRAEISLAAMGAELERH